MKGIRILLPLVFVILLAPTLSAGSAGVVATVQVEQTKEVVSQQIVHAVPQGPQYVAESREIPWGGFLAIPAFALVFLFPVIAVRYFPARVNPVPSQP